MKRRGGFTLVEVVISLAIIGVVMYAGIAIYVTSGFKGVNVDVYTAAQALAEGKLEEWTSRNFADCSSEAESGFGGDFANYSYQVTVNFVSAEALDAPVGGPTNFKKVTVRIRHDSLGNPLSLEAIRSNI